MVGVISAGLALLVAGETQFDALGFALVMAASALSGLRWTITQLQLQGSDGHGAAPGMRCRGSVHCIVSCEVLVDSWCAL